MTYETLALYIDGTWASGEGRPEQEVLNPATDEILGRLPHATTADLDRALTSAQRAFESWRKSSPMERSQVLRKVGELTRERAPQIARNLTLDQGKPLAEALAEVKTCANVPITERIPIWLIIFTRSHVSVSTAVAGRATTRACTLYDFDLVRAMPAALQYRKVIASVSCFITSTRRSWPFTLSVINRSTLPGADDWPLSWVVRNR